MTMGDDLCRHFKHWRCVIGSQFVPVLFSPNGSAATQFLAGRLPVDCLLPESGLLRLEDINQGFEDLAAGNCVRQVILF